MALLHRRLLPRLQRRLSRRRVTVLCGARQTGKTTLARDLLDPVATPPLLYRTLDDPDERLTLARDPVRLLDRPERLVVLDEVQKQPGLLDAVKLLVDRSTGPKFLLLGSSRILLLQQVRESLAGRAALLDLWPFAVAERLEETADAELLLDRIFDHGPAALATAGDLSAEAGRRARAAAEETLRSGGYPPLLSLAEEVERREWLRDYRRTFLERDLADLGRVADLDQFAHAQAWVAAHSGELASYSELARDLGVAVNTAKRYVRFLEVSYQAVLVPPFLPRVDRRLAKRPKVLWTDVGLARVLTGRADLEDGPLFETHVGVELLKWCSFRDDAPELCYYRSHGGLEVDFVLHAPAALVAVECKASTRVHRERATALSRFLAETGAHARRRLGLLVYRGREVAQLAPEVWAVPDWLLFAPRAASPPR